MNWTTKEGQQVELLFSVHFPAPSTKWLSRAIADLCFENGSSKGYISQVVLGDI